ncbi:hypothetical protein [Hydrogenophaga sp. PAMC20947]|uniref:hypothetical protein n=1 Tax=Hydrogenophaga sp. PAMC20947 TaxID=2565558 RepID=UPI00109E0EFC|nr:hypothetical protein [Hydrogenophaga sp. PAMC20947]QCB46284.1 hypothetical protein E5678_09780 [Hydrogenophaga sp. PAMC20947]
MRVSLALTSFLFCLCSASAQTTFPTEYPAEATAIAGTDLTARLAGKVFTVKSATNGNWRLEFDNRGYVFVDTDQGFRDNGPWLVEGEKWCTKLPKAGDNCSELYAVGNVLYYKRARNGEVVPMTLR